MNVASFTVRATVHQSARWKQAAEGEGFASVGSWAARALDAYLQARTRAGRPIPLSWHRGLVRVVLDGAEVTVRGMVSPPFACFRGTAEGPVAGHKFSLIHLPTGKLIATLRRAGQARSLAAELAPAFARGEAGTATVERHISEQT